MTQSSQEQKADPSAQTIPLAAAPQTAEPASTRRGHGSHVILTGFVLVLAFLAASFAARNSDVWFHLATGRLLAQGRFSFGVDPFAYTTQQVYWACHSWLFDWVLYGLRGLIGDAGLVVLKAIIVTALAGLLLSIRRPTAGWLPAVCTTLALLAISPRLLLQPACVSYFLLGLTLWLLWRGQTQASARYWPLLLVFIPWVNVDEWFLLGPLVTALFWLGQRLHGNRQMPGWIVPATFAVCLLNPFTYHALSFPAELSPVTWTSGLRDDARFRALFASPWETEHLRAAMQFNAAILAYYVLTLLGLMSFLLHRPALRDWRLLIWLPFALLAAWQARFIPFFAIVAAPITALNWQDIQSAKGATRSPTGRFLNSTIYLVLLLSLMSLIAHTWLGWLAGYNREERHVAWGIQPEPSLRQAAQTLAEWRRQGLLHEGERVFALAPQSAHYDAWFCPGEKCFFDDRYPLFSQTAREYESVCRALLSSPTGTEPERSGDWQQVFRDHKVGIVVFYDRDPQRLFAVLQRLANDPQQWTLLRVAGQALIAGWNPARPSGGFDALAFDADRLAYGPPDAQSQSQALTAPEQGPQSLPSRRDLWKRLAHSPSSPSWQSAAATMYLHYFHDSEGEQVNQQLRILQPSYVASLAGLAAQPSGLTTLSFQLVSSQKMLTPGDLLPGEQLGPFFAPLAERPPALLLLAIRAARQAAAADPEDANAWLRLGQVYMLMRDTTCEHFREGQMMPPLAQLRHVQIVTALEQAVRLDPNLEAAHHELAYLYGASNALDQALEHRQDEARLSRKAGPRPGESAADFAYRMEYLEKDTAKLVDLVQQQRKTFASASHSFQGDRSAQARHAVRLGLARKAVEEILFASPADLLGPDGIRMEMELLLSLGKAEDVRGILSDEGLRSKKHGLGFSNLPPPRDGEGRILYSLPYHWPAYEWLHVLEAAAVGDYAQCREGLRAIRPRMQAEHERRRLQSEAFARRDERWLLGSFSASPPFLPAFIALFVNHSMEERTRLEADQRTLLSQQADLWVLEGLLALEQGDSDAARSAFAQAHAVGATGPFVGRPIVAGYLGKLNSYHTKRRPEPRPEQ